MIDYPAILRAAGLQVVEYPRWRQRTSDGGFTPRAVMVHHDASPEGPSDGVARYIAETAPYAPLSQLWVDYHGVWHVLAHGNCNHAGRGDGWGPIPAGRGNEYAVGVETDFTTGESLREPFYSSVVAGVRALCDALDLDPSEAVCGHKEYAPGRKSDPDWDMDRFRRDVAGLTTTEEDDDMVPDGDRMKDVQEDLNWIREHSEWVWPELTVDGVWGPKTSGVLDGFRAVWGLRTRDARPNGHDLSKIDRTIHEIKEHALHGAS